MYGYFKYDNIGLTELKIEFQYKGDEYFNNKCEFRDTNWSIKSHATCPQLCVINCKLPPNSTIYFKLDNRDYSFSKSFSINKLSATKRNSTDHGLIYHNTLHLKNVTLIDPAKLNKKTELDDILVKIDGHQLYLNKTILEYHSPEFKKILFSDSKIISEEIDLKGKDFSRFIDFLSSFYYNGEPYTNGLIVEFSILRSIRLLPLFYEYNMNSHVTMCEDVISKFLKKIQLREVGEENYTPVAILLGVLAETFGKEELRSAVITVLARVNLKRWKREESWMKLSESTRYRIMDLALDNHTCIN